MTSSRDKLRNVKNARPWVSGHASLFVHGYFDRRYVERHALSDHEHAVAAVHWIGRAQDITGDGGICGRYRLDRGWTSSYPETTGYLVPTLLRLATEWQKPDLKERAKRAIEFLLPLQLPSGAFPGLEIRENRTEPSPFNTAQILNGLIGWHRETREARALEAAKRAGDWLISIQDDDGAWRKHVYMGVSSTYSAHASCWLAELGAHCGDAKYIAAAERHLNWVLSKRDPETGFIDFSGFSKEDHEKRRAVTHTLAYTLAGMLFTARIAKRQDAIDAVRFAAERIARRIELEGDLPGMLDHRFRRAADYTCLTGNCQMALIFMQLFEMEGDGRFLNAAFKAIDRVKAAQPVRNPNPGIRGGIPGSWPVDGGYIHLALPNWAAKFFLDALLEKKRILAALERGELRMRPARTVSALNAAPSIPATESAGPPKIALLTTPRSAKCARLLAALHERGIDPAALIVERPIEAPLSARLRARMREDGLRPFVDKVLGRKLAAAHRQLPTPPSSGALDLDVISTARKAGIAVIEVSSLRDERDLAQLRSAAFDLFVTAGAGILRTPLLAIPRLGTINAHMGRLPEMRGMNVAEWSVLCGVPIAATIHMVDAGVDTGDILHVVDTDIAQATSIETLRRLVDAAQIEALADTILSIAKSGGLPPRRKQTAAEGRQYFTLHSDLRALLERRLANRGS